MRPALLRRAAAPKAAPAACQICKPFSRPPPATPCCPAARPAPRLLRAPRPGPRGALLCTTLRSRRAPCHLALLVLLALFLRRARMRPAVLWRAAASKAACASCQFLNRSLDYLLATPRCPAGPLPHAFFASVACGLTVRSCAGRCDISVRLAHRVARDDCSRLAPCKHAARAVAPRRGFQSCPRRVPNSQTVLPILRRQRLAARPATLPHVFFASAARGLTACCSGRRCELAARLAT